MDSALSRQGWRGASFVPERIGFLGVLIVLLLLHTAEKERQPYLKGNGKKCSPWQSPRTTATAGAPGSALLGQARMAEPGLDFRAPLFLAVFPLLTSLQLF